MNTEEQPFNINILKLTKERLRTLSPVTNMEIYEPGSREFSADGLFSASIFGVPGDTQRDKRFSYINLNTDILHPYSIYLLKKLKRLYIDIMNGKEYAVYDKDEKDFIRSNALDGETGYSFFMQHLSSLHFKETDSAKRKFYIDIFDRFKDDWITKFVMVLPAGLRDIDINERGKVSKDPINDHYRRIVSNSNLIEDEHVTDKMYDQARIGMQNGFNDVFKHINDFLKGKTGYIIKKFASRALYYGTRNVITSMNISSEILGDKNTINTNHSQVGLYQHAKSIEPVTKHLLKKNFISNIFIGNRVALLVDKKTFKRVQVTVSSETYDRWVSVEGIGKIVNELEYPDARHKPVIIEDHYAALIYQDNVNFKIFSDIDDLPRNFDPKYVRPISKIEMVHLSGYTEWEKYPAWITRYPAIEMGSTYPSIPIVKTTLSQLSLLPLDDNWTSKDEATRCYNYPDRTVNSFFETLSPNDTRLSGLGADFDGDMTNYNASFTDDSVKEIMASFKKASTYLDIDGGFRNSLSSDYSNMVLLYLTYTKA